jgi:4-amino-4-deoxy-L-arabinose transferase-like glycosyltransferase
MLLSFRGIELTDRTLSATQARLSLGEILLAAVAVYLVAAKLWLGLMNFPIADEAYYWMWGQHLAWSYFDHPPLHGWLQGLSHLVFGRSTFALRWLSLATFIGTAWILQDVARRIAGEKWRVVFLKSLVVYLASPMFGIFGSIVFHDYLMVFLVIASGYLFTRYFVDVEAGNAGHRGHLFGAAALLGLAALTKYNAGLLGFAVLGAILIRPRLRPLLLRPDIYLAALLAIAIQTPVLIYALQTDFASFRFHLEDRFTDEFTGLNWRRMQSATINVVTMLSPFFLVALLRFLLSWKLVPFERPARMVALLLFLLSTLPLLYYANLGTILPWWNIVAFTLILPVAGRHIDRVTLTLHALYGMILTTFFAVSFTIVPVLMLFGGKPTLETEHAFGWTDIGRAVLESSAQYQTDFLATNRYQTASQLGFELDDPDVLALSSRRDAFDDWSDMPSHAGQDAIVLIDGREDIETYKRHFARLTEVGTYTAAPLGYPVLTYTIYLGEDFIAAPPD